jgi:hypothetical protein
MVLNSMEPGKPLFNSPLCRDEKKAPDRELFSCYLAERVSVESPYEKVALFILYPPSYPNCLLAKKTTKK